MFVSVVIPTYNRREILEKCLDALERQVLNSDLIGYEVVVVDDGSTDGTTSWLRDEACSFPHVRLFEQEHGGPAAGRNRGVENSLGDVIVFIDSDLVVTETFLACHVRSLKLSWQRRGDLLCFTYGTVINTDNFENPTSEPYKFLDYSWAYFATGNVAIHREILEESGLFDINFYLYGWEDLELGERLKQMNVELIKCPKAIGYHWHPAFKLEQVSGLIRVERERAKMALVFYRKHPSLRVRFIIQFTFLHYCLWEILTLGGLLNEKTLKPLMAMLIRKGHPKIALELLRIPLNRIAVKEMYREAHMLGII